MLRQWLLISFVVSPTEHVSVDLYILLEVESALLFFSNLKFNDKFLFVMLIFKGVCEN